MEPHHIFRTIVIPIRKNEITILFCFQVRDYVAASVVSSDQNVTVSTLTFTPKIKDNGSLLACQAKVNGLVGSAKDDSMKIIVHCKYSHPWVLYFILKLCAAEGCKENGRNVGGANTQYRVQNQ